MITNEFNAWFGRFGLRGHRVMGLGLPMLAVLTAEQRVALVAHEVAHDVNGDPVRGRYIGNAYGALRTLHGMLTPIRWRTNRRGGGVMAAEATIGGAFTNTALRIASRVTRPFVTAFEVLMRRESQRGEYLADALSADVAGAAGARSMLRASHLAPMLDATAQSIVAARGDKDDLFASLRRRIAATPASSIW